MQQPKQIIDGEVTYYEYADGFASAADGCGWVSALFVSVDAARSWRGHFTDAEIEFRRMNGGPQGAALVPHRVEDARHIDNLKAGKA